MKCNIKELAEKNGYSLRSLSKVLGLKSPTTLTYWAANKTMPNRVHFDRLCWFLNCGLNELFTIEPFDPLELEEQINHEHAKLGD
jgi:transcriptional regulator with XRE-family HTH domain